MKEKMDKWVATSLVSKGERSLAGDTVRLNFEQDYQICAKYIEGQK